MPTPPIVKRQLPPAKKNTQTKGTKVSDIASRIVPVSLNSANFKISLYGKSGSGKTTFACATWPKPMLIVGTEDGTKSVHNVKGLDFIRVYDSIDFIGILRLVEKYKTILIDTATGVQELYLREILGLKELPPQLSWGLATQQQWGQCALKTKETLRAFLELDKNIIVTAQEKEFKNDGESEVISPFVGSFLSPSVLSWLNPACDYIVQTSIRAKYKKVQTKIGGKITESMVRTDEKEYCLRVGPHETYITKFRRPLGATKLPEFIVDPTYEKFVKVVSGN